MLTWFSDQILQLRTLLPGRLWDPILTTIENPAVSKYSRSPAALFAHLQKTANDGYQEVENFKSIWHSDEMQALWEKTNVEVFPQGNDTWMFNHQPLANQIKNPEIPSAEAETSAVVEEDFKETLQKFQERNRTIKVRFLDQGAEFSLHLKFAGMSFRIDRETGNSSGGFLVLSDTEKKISDLQQGILHSINNSNHQESLSRLLVSLTPSNVASERRLLAVY